MKRALVVSIALLALSACRPDTIQLDYRYPEQGELSYRLEAVAHASWDIGSPGEGSYRVVFDVVESVRAEESGAHTVAVVMTPITVEEDGLPSPGTEERSFSLRIDDNGEVLEVLEIDGVEAEALDPDELAFIGMYRPPLPTERVGLGESWTAQQAVDLGDISQQVVTEGTLEALDEDRDGPVAEMRYRGSGPLVWTTALTQGEAELVGGATTNSTAVLDVEEGSLRAARSSTEGTFEVRVVPEGDEAPISGELTLNLDLSLERP